MRPWHPLVVPALLAALSPVLPAQGAEPPAAEPPPATADDPSPPDPSTWILDPDGLHRDWLGKPPLDPADLAARPQAYAEALESHGLLLDLEGGSLSIRGATLHDQATLGYPIEYLVVTERGKTHEAALIVRAQPSMIEACLAALELAPGSPTRFERKDPPPSEEQLDAGVSAWTMTTAGGPLVSMVVSWIDADGRPRSHDLEELLLAFPPDATAPVKLETRHWIYAGSRRGVYRQGRDKVSWHKADVEGDVVAIYLDGREVCPFERNDVAGLLDSLYTLDPDVVPEAGTRVTLTLRATGEAVEAGPYQLDQTPEAVTSER